MADVTELETSYIFADSDPLKVREAAHLVDEFVIRTVRELGVALMGGTVKINVFHQIDG